MDASAPAGPDFLVIGAAKSGTTALDEFLRRHPDARLPSVREPNHFAFVDDPPDLRDHRGRPAALTRTTITDPAAYRRAFPSPGPHTRAGETSPAYLYVPGTAERIARVRPDVRLVAILREPGARAFSAYQHLRREGREPLTFRQALDAEPERIAQRWGLLWRYVDTGRYGSQLLRYLDVFPREQVLLLRHDELTRDPSGTLRRVLGFVGLDPDVDLDTSGRFNVSGVPRSRFLHAVTNPPAGVRRAVARLVPTGIAERLRGAQARALSRNLEKVEADPADLARVRQALADQTRVLADLTGWDLASWLPG